MTPSSGTTDAARRLWARMAGDTHEPTEIARAAEQLGARVRLGLGRWIGADAYQTLLQRAAATARSTHPSLNDVAGLSENASVTLAAVRVHGAAAVVDGVVAVVALVIELLGRIIGQEMARHLVEQCGAPSPPAFTSTESKESAP